MKNKFKNGFTLVELLVVVAIIGVLASMAVLSISGPQKTSRDTRRKTELKQYQNSLEIYATKNESRYPIYDGGTKISSATPNLCNDLGVDPCREDPRTGTYDYMYQSNLSGTQYVLWADLEKDSEGGGVANYFVLCSNGQSGIALEPNMPPTGGVCPTLVN